MADAPTPSPPCHHYYCISLNLGAHFDQACFRELKQLLTTLKLKLNDCKTEFLVLMSPHQLRKYGLPYLQLGTVLINPAVSVRNLGAHFDQMLTMVSFINHKIKVASCHLRRIGSIRK